MTQKDIINEYFEWLCDLVCQRRFAKPIPFRKVFMRLHDTEFIFSVYGDEDRAEDGVSLRYRFATTHGYKEYKDTILEYLRGPCSVLEMMVAIAVRCEETIMDDPSKGDRTGQWFWVMMRNLGLNSMTDEKYNKRVVDDILDRFLNREYDPDGKGGLFVLHHCDTDLRYVSIWHQLCWYLNNIV